MTDIKSINHQSIHSTQSAQAEATQKNSEIVKEYKPAEFRPLSDDQKENIKQTRNAENKMAESAIKSLMDWPSTPAEVKNGSPRSEGVGGGGSIDGDEDLRYLSELPTTDLPMGTGPLGELPTLDHVKKAWNNPEPTTELPMGTGPTGELPDLDDLKSGLKKVDKYLKPVTDVIREKIKGDS